MAKDREAPCLYYICMGECKKCRDTNPLALLPEM